MKSFKKIFIGFIVAIVILGLAAFYFPGRNFRTTAPSQPTTEEQSASFPPIVSTPSSPTTTTTVPTAAATSSVSSTASLKEMPGFSDLNQESDWLEDLGDSTSTEELNDAFKEINQ